MIDFRCSECGEEMSIKDRMAGKRVRCVNCDAKVTVPDESSDQREERRLSRKRPQQLSARAELRQIALYQKGIIFSILVYLLAVPAQFFVPQDLRLLFLVAVLPFVLTGPVFVYLLTFKLYDVGIAVVLILLTFIPLLGLFVLLGVNREATRALQLHGCRVGLFGAKLSDLD